ncbi:GNAT family N-acetyltransferase [Pseudoduganella sp. FT93W]|uniref:GNAT family N-acetyltransferase n=1 Tax=Duganella fentianensis TaxID=2692177 RepID=A0A845HVJ0_9BURK|nr:GNAT family N-acetyltransferase [Duganella fentianensis]MYN43541.1 GNAT family N-acetyltransferase [Duganella fentianensis]
MPQSKTTIIVRKAVAADTAAVLALYRELRPNDPPIEDARIATLWQEVAEGPRSSILVAEYEQEVAATCMLAFLPNLASDGRPIGVIEHVVTAHRFRRRGLSKKLLEFALAVAWRANCCKVCLLSGAQRTVAHDLYKAVGFDGDVERGFVAKPGTSSYKV